MSYWATADVFKAKGGSKVLRDYSEQAQEIVRKWKALAQAK